MYARGGFNITWMIVSIVIVGNVFLFNALFNNVKNYSEKIVSTKTSKYELEDI
jgi:hypothetical protein